MNRPGREDRELGGAGGEQHLGLPQREREHHRLKGELRAAGALRSRDLRSPTRDARVVGDHHDVAHGPARVEEHARGREPPTALLVVALELHLDDHPGPALARRHEDQVGAHLQPTRCATGSA